jgi:hypothetical protein
MGTGVKPEQVPRVPTYDEWQAAQYAPHRAGTDDPTKPMPLGRVPTFDEFEQAQRAASVKSLTFPALPKLPPFAADATQRLNPNAGPADKSIPEQMGAGVRHVASGFDAAALGLGGPASAGASVAAALARQVVAPAVEHPLLTAALANPVGAVIGTGMAVHTIAQYGWQKAHELQMSPEDRAKSEADPNRVSGEAAAVQAVMLGLGGLAGVKGLAKATDVGAGMMEAGARGAQEGAHAALDFQVPELAQGKTGAIPYLESPKGAELLGTTAAHTGLPATASPYPPDSPLAAAWQQGHASTTASEATPGVAPVAPGATETAPTAPTAPSGGLGYKGPVALYKRLSDDALGAEYRALLERRTQEEPNAMAPLWDAEREARAVEQIENRRRPDGSLAPEDKRRLGYLQASQGEGYGVGRHTFESAAAERRVNEMTRHLIAIENEINNRGLNPDELMQPSPSGGGGSLASIEGTGDVKTRGLSLGVEQRAISHELTDYLGELPEYRTANMAEHTAKAAQLLADDPALARRVALGEENPPAGMIPELVFKVVEDKATAEGDVATLRDLASGDLTRQATDMGRRIRALGERDPESPVAAIQKIADARGGGAKNVTVSIADAVKELKTHLETATTIDAGAWGKFIDSIRC